MLLDASRKLLPLLETMAMAINGYEVARRLRAEPLTRSVALIALTGYGQLSDRNAAIQAGFDAHFVKQADLDEIVKTIEKLFAPDKVVEG